MFVIQIGNFFLRDERMDGWNSLGQYKDAVRFTDYRAANRIVGEWSKRGVLAQVVGTKQNID